MFPRAGSICEEDSCSGEENDDYIQLDSKIQRIPNNKNNWNHKDVKRNLKLQSGDDLPYSY